MRQTKRERVDYTVLEPIEIEGGVWLPAGRYAGLKETGGIETMKGMVWTAPRYGLELFAEQLAEMGRKNQGGLDTITYDLSKFVKGGQVLVS